MILLAMQGASRHGFILPFSLLLATAILILATLILAEGEYELEQRRQALLRQRARSTLQAQVAPRVADVNRLIRQGSACSAFGTAAGAAGIPGQTVLLHADGSAIPLHSPAGEPGSGQVAFRSAVSDARLLAGFQELSPPGEPVRITTAWAAEDIALTADPAPPPAFWPLPSWFHAPSREPLALDEFLAAQMGPAWDNLPWIAEGNPLPYSPGLSPALVPVPVSLGLRLGIFASGAIGNREKVIRIRYYLEGSLWNPYNRPLTLHAGGGLAPLFRMVARNLPEVRIRNLSQGLASGWISLDAAANDSSGASGVHGWIRGKPALAPGEVVTFLEPDPKSQPEGLARTLHRAFMVGPADHVVVEFRTSGEGLELVLLESGATDPMAAAEAGQGWFRVAGDRVADFPKLEFPRADEGAQPFYIEEGSLAFQIGNARLQLMLDRSAAIARLDHDPRLARVPASGVKLQILDLARRPPAAPAPPAPGAVFSWPTRRPQDVLTATDLPAWRDAFLIGTPGASALNRLFDANPDWPGAQSARIERVTAAGDTWAFGPALPVNSLSPSAWGSLLAQSTAPTGVAGRVSYPAFMTISPDRAEDFRTYPARELQAAMEELTRSLLHEPCRSVAEFHDRGLLAAAIPAAVPEDPLHRLMPMRGWLRRAPPLRPHGSAWILHLAVEAAADDLSVRQTARVWLLEAPEATGAAAFRIIRFEWTDPALHAPAQPR